MKEITIEQAENELLRRVAKADIEDMVYQSTKDIIADIVVDMESDYTIVDSEGNPCDSYSTLGIAWYDEPFNSAMRSIYDKVRGLLGKRKVYVVVVESCYDFGCDERRMKVFASREDALAEFRKEVADTKPEDEQNGCTIEESETSYCAFREGYYSEDHININLEEYDVL